MFLTKNQINSFWAKVNKTENCWLWQGSTNGVYGKLQIRPRIWLAHRLSYAIAYGNIPKGLVIDHICNKPLCVNPFHLQAITQRKNVLRSSNVIAQQVLRTRCPKGHEYDYFYKNKRMCRTCRKLQRRKISV